MLKALSYNFVNFIWFSKEDNIIRGPEVTSDIGNNVTPFEKETRITECDLTTTCRFCNNPCIFKVSKMLELYNNVLLPRNPHFGKLPYRQYSVEETLISYIHEVIKNHRWHEVRDQICTFLYGNPGDGPYIAHLDGSKRYQSPERINMAEINGHRYLEKFNNTNQI